MSDLEYSTFISVPVIVKIAKLLWSATWYIGTNGIERTKP